VRRLGPGDWPLSAALAVHLSAFAAVYLGIWALLPRGWTTLLDLKRLALEFRLEKRGPGQKLTRTPP
jgi:hypothetical protein